jgi:ankyrin repeat protein
VVSSKRKVAVVKRLSWLAVACLVFLPSSRASAESQDLRLVDATKRNDSKTAAGLIKQAAGVNSSQPDGATPLHWAAHWDDIRTAELLIKAGADVNAQDKTEVTPLVLACLNGSAPMVDLLLKAGALPNVGKDTAVMMAARTGNADVMKLLLAKGGNVNTKESERGQTALMWAAAEKHPEVLRLLLENGADVGARTVAPAPPAGADGQAARRRPPSNGANGFTALLFAARVGDVDGVRILLDGGAKPNDTTDDGMSALVMATVRGFPAVAMLLLDRGADPNADGAGYTALHWAAGSWETELTVTNITTDREGEWSTVAGLKEGRLELVKALLAHGAAVNARVKKSPARAGSSKNPGLPEIEGATPFLLAALAGAPAVMQALVAGGADVHLRTTSNGTPLMAAAGLGRVQGEVLVPESQTLAAAKLVVELGGADVDAVDAVGNTALHYAAYMRRDSIIQLLATQGANLEIRNKFGETPLLLSEIVIQFAGGGTYQVVPSTTGELLRKLGAQKIPVPYTLRPRYWPDLAHT